MNPIKMMKNIAVKNNAIKLIKDELKGINRVRAKAKVRLWESRGNDEQSAKILREMIELTNLGNQTLERLSKVA